MGPRRRSSLAASPLLIGGVTTLIAVVAVFLSYNANNGLPFVPTYNLKIVLPETSELQPNNQVRIAGTRVGVISSLTPHQSPTTGRVTAIADLKLEKGVEPLPANTKAVVQSTSSIGTKYLELERGTSQATLKQGATIPVGQTREPVDLNQFFDMFDQKTRTAIQKNTINFGDGLAARGLGLNETIATLRPLVTNAIPVLHNLAAPKTGFGELWRALDRPAAQTAPVAQQNANFWSDLDTFFRAWAGVAPSLERAIEGGAPALRAGHLLARVRGALHGKKRRIHAPAAPNRERAAHDRRAARPRVRRRRCQPQRRHRAELASSPKPHKRSRPSRRIPLSRSVWKT